LYVSNVEQYLSSERFAAYMRNVAALPRTERSVVIRAVFGYYDALGRGSRSTVQTLDRMVDGYSSGAIRSYRDLIP
jgi:hypothetical protein